MHSVRHVKHKHNYTLFVFIHERFFFRCLFVGFVQPVRHEIKQYTISFIVIVLFYILHLTNKPD